MVTREGIRAKYKKLHDDLSEAYYGGTSGLSKEEFDFQHGKIWSDMEDELIAEGYSSPPEPSLSTHISIIDAIDTSKARPVRVRRVWEGKDYFYDCFVTESVKDQYLAGDVVVGDYVIVHFDDIGELVVTEKVFKSW